MPVTVLVGCQWGDEGKGKVADLLSRRMDWVARYGGGHNAGHTVYLSKNKFILHLIPCGILQKKPKCVIGHGTVIDPLYLVREMEGLEQREVKLRGRLFIAQTAHLVLPYHRWLETLEGQDTRIGTTRQGIGPAYQDKAGRLGLRMIELVDPDRLPARLAEQAERVAERFRSAGVPLPEPLEPALDSWTRELETAAKKLRPFVDDTVQLLHDALRKGERILCEGAQGTFLDLDMGTYPYVTSSTTTSAGAATGLGLPPSVLRKVVGVCKAYTTRVGEGPFPTEMVGEDGSDLRRRGGEFGATTGRPRRVGWLDLALLRQAVRLNGVTGVFLTKLDILSDIPEIKVGTGYRLEGQEIDFPPADATLLARCDPVYAALPGWSGSLKSIRRFADLPEAARRYIRFVEESAGCRVQAVSVGSPRTAVVPVPSPSSRG